MKNRFFCILMTGALACGSPFALHAQTDVTDTYLVNPSFETYLEGWEFDDLLPQSNDGLVTKDGATYVEKWIGTGNAVGSGGVSQTIPSMANGTYQLTVAAHNIRQDNSDPQSGAYIFADDVRVAAVVYWTFGDLGGTYWKDIAMMLVVVLAAFVYFYFNRWNYNAIQSGEETAKGLGVNTDALLLVGMLVCAFTAAMIVSNVGLINFVGLIAPHMVRRFVGSDYRFLLPASGLAGSILLLLSDIVARMAVSPVVLPIGAITSFVGAPVFLMIIFRESKRR